MPTYENAGVSKASGAGTIVKNTFPVYGTHSLMVSPGGLV